MKLAALVSGGKDSIYAIYRARMAGHEIKYILVVLPESDESWMFHHPNAALARLQAESMGIEVRTAVTKGEKEKELDDLKDLMSQVKDEVDGIVTGAISSKYQSDRIKKICDSLGLEVVSPLWGRELAAYWEEMITNGFEIIVVSVSAQGLGREWIGRRMDAKAVAELKDLGKKHKINLAGEGGEFETLVLDCPMFKRKIRIVTSEKRWDSKTGSGALNIREARLE